MQMSTALRNVLADCAVNGGSGVNFDSGVIEFRSGSAPGADAADSGTLVWSITLPADAFAAASSGVAAISGTWEDADGADAAVTVAHFRIKQSGDSGGATGATDERMEGSVGLTSSGADIELQDVTPVIGQPLEITSGNYTQPAGS